MTANNSRPGKQTAKADDRPHAVPDNEVILRRNAHRAHGIGNMKYVEGFSVSDPPGRVGEH